ncbi:MAG: HesA/MoeB/ThiF family protein [Sedimentisphaerales bacterium]|nr:HesA/MoeB/ThiF family protein [Sedimentisphaerales bacterium]
MSLTEQQILRYSRQLILEQVGGRGQQRLLSGKVLIIGAGGLGSPAALYLAAAGIGTIGIADCDNVDITNLQRQVIHHAEDLGRPKVESAAARIRAINPDVRVRTYGFRVCAANVMELVRDYDFVIDGTDNFAAKFLINDACVLANRPFSHAGILRFEGQLMTILPGRSACYRCVFRQPPPAGAVPNCAQAGVLGPVAGVIGCLQAIEAIKFLLGIEGLLTDVILTYNALPVEFRKIPVHQMADCPVCGKDPVITAPMDSDQPICDMEGSK